MTDPTEPEFWTILKNPLPRRGYSDVIAHRFVGDGTSFEFYVPANQTIMQVYFGNTRIPEGEMYITFNSVIIFDSPVPDGFEVVVMAEPKGA